MFVTTVVMKVLLEIYSTWNNACQSQTNCSSDIGYGRQSFKDVMSYLCGDGQAGEILHTDKFLDKFHDKVVKLSYRNKLLGSWVI